MVENTNHPSALRRFRRMARNGFPPARLSQKVKSLAPQRHEGRLFCLPGVAQISQKTLCLRVFVVQGFYAFCDGLDVGNERPRMTSDWYFRHHHLPYITVLK